MNASGEAVSYLVKRYDIEMNDLIVIHDDLTCRWVKLESVRAGRFAGHRGISPSFLAWRVRTSSASVSASVGRRKLSIKKLR